MSATRDDAGKLDASLFFEGMPTARIDTTNRSRLGAERHGRMNWRSSIVEEKERKEFIQKCRSSLSRHFWDFMDGKTMDEDGLTNLSGVIWNASVLTEYMRADR